VCIVLLGVEASARALLDALNTFEGPVIEVHISNIHKREAFRHNSLVSLRAEGVIAGLGTDGYTLALRHLAKLVDAFLERGPAVLPRPPIK